MAKTISQLPDATVVNGSDELIIQQSGVTKRATKTEVLAGIVNANIDAAAAIAGTKIAPNFGAQNVVTTGACGIGTTSPAAIAKLDVQGGRTLLSANSEPYAVGAKFVNTGGAVYFGAASNSATPDAVISSAGGAELMRLANGGNVGIGTTSPGAKLHVVGPNALRISGESGDYTAAQLINASGVELQVFANANAGAGIFTNTNHPLDFSTNNTQRMRIDASGNVGIGTASPNSAALIDASSTTQGFLPPRMTTAQRDAISSPPAGLMIYNTTTNKLNVRTASSWEAVTSS